jgi:4-alpha-glucanotransferase
VCKQPVCNQSDTRECQPYSAAEGGAWGFIRLGMSSVSKATVFTMQDVLSLGNEARMNTPGVANGNWAWRVGPPGGELYKLNSAETQSA